MIDRLSAALETVKEQMTDPEKTTSISPEEKAMTEEKKPPRKKKATNGAAKVAKKKTNGHAEGMISLAELAKELKVDATAARVKLRKAEIERPEGRWAWKDPSGALTAVRKVLSKTE